MDSVDDPLQRVLLAPDMILKIALELLKLERHARATPHVGRASLVCRTWHDSMSGEGFWHLAFLTCYPRTESATWMDPAEFTREAGWKGLFQRMFKVCTVLLWVEDDDTTVAGYALRIHKSSVSLHHAKSTEAAKKWLTSEIESLHPSLRIITDNVRVEEKDGERKNNYNAGRELVTWLHSGQTGLSKIPVMMFCGDGSVPYVQDLAATYDNLKIETRGGMQ